MYLSTREYKELTQLLKENKHLPLNSTLWKRIIDSIDDVTPGFYQFMRRLANGKLDNDEMRLLALIRYQLTPVQISDLISKTRGTITYRRKKLCQKLFLGKVSIDEFDNIIRLL